MDRVLFTSNTDHWATPSDIYKVMKELGYFDPCPFMCSVDMLSQPWEEDCYINPPYSKVKVWIDEILDRFSKGSLRSVFLLVPARTDTKWFRKLIDSPFLGGVFFITGRLHFNDSDQSAPFPSVFFYLCRDRYFYPDFYWYDKDGFLKLLNERILSYGQIE